MDPAERKSEVMSTDILVKIKRSGRIVRYVLWKAKPGSIVIFHINGKGWTTAETLPKIIEGMRAKGYRFVTVSELLR